MTYTIEYSEEDGEYAAWSDEHGQSFNHMDRCPIMALTGLLELIEGIEE